MNKGMINRRFPGNKGYDSRYISSKVIVFPAALFLCALFAVVKPVEVKAGTYKGTVKTSQFNKDEDVQINGDTEIIIDSNKTIKTMSSNVLNITVTITGDTSNTLTCEGLSFGNNETGYGTLIINSANLKVTKTGISAKNIEINGGTIETKSEDSYAIYGKDGVVVINGGNVTADGTDGIFLDSDKQITISNNAKVTATGDVFGIASATGNINIDNATVTATGRVDANGSGISTNGNVTITDATVTAKGVSHAIYTAGGPGDNKISISGASTVVKASCEDEDEDWAAIEVAEGKMTISEPLEVSSPVGGGLSADGKYIATKAGGTDKAKEVEIKGHIYTVTFDANGGEGEMDPQAMVEGVKTQLNKNEFTRSGYKFKNWNTKADGSGEKYEDKQSVKIEGDMTLYAQWEEEPDPTPTPEPKDKQRPLVLRKDDSRHEDDTLAAATNPLSLILVKTTGLPYGTIAARAEQGVAAKAVFKASTPAGWKEGFSFNLITNGKNETTLKNGSFTLLIPKDLQKTGRTFAILALDKSGKAILLTDTDTDPTTITVSINLEGYAFDLIYKD